VETRWERLEDLFGEASALEPNARRAFLERECGGDQALRAELLSLLDAHDAAAGPLDESPRVGRAADAQDSTLVGTCLGPWRIEQLIGSGGAGHVYLASRIDGTFEQQVAVKVLRRDGSSDLERFHAERRILARLDHPRIARLLDGGLLPDGRPYAVMEFVQGRPLTEHCRETNADAQTRLTLFLQICDAVAYAHANLIVHRDLKPANILVDADGRVELLDFGIAKLLETSLASAAADKTSAPLTLDYAAPEQLTGEPATTATDIYALGVILFELLTGDRPWRSEGLPMARAVKLLLDEEAPAASRAAESQPGAPVAAKRLKGDLDAIIARCLRKDPRHRYDSVSALRADIERHMRHEPVQARGGARAYVIGRFMRRHRWPVAGAIVVALSLLAALAVTLWQVNRVSLERDIANRVAAREEAMRYYLTSMFRSSIEQGAGTSVTAKAMLDRSAQRVLKEYQDDPHLAGKVVETLADLYGALGDVEGQVPLLQTFLAQAGTESDPESIASARQKLANLEVLRGDARHAATLLDQADAFWATDPARFREQQLEGMFVRGALLRSQGNLAGSIDVYRRAIAGRTTFSGYAHRETANLYNSLAITLTAAGRLEDALAAYRKALDIHAQLGRSEDLDALVMLGNTGTLAYRTGRTREAEQILKTAFEKQSALAGESAAVAAAMGLYGAAVDAHGHSADAAVVLRKAVDLATQFSGPDSPLTIQNRLFLAEALSGSGDSAGAQKLIVETAARARAKFGESHVLTLRAALSQARINNASGRHADAAGLLDRVIAELNKLGPPAHLHLALALVTQGDALLRMGKAVEAIPVLERALAVRGEFVWTGSWELAEARMLLGAALNATGDSRGRALVEQSIPVLTEQLGADHPLAQRARSVL
jgi:non-specific serine/threonine protein kinase/serine/threonine-protein kinase